MAYFKDTKMGFRGTMTARFATFSALFYVVFWNLAVCVTPANSALPIVHTVSMQNETTIPLQYQGLPVVGKCCGGNEILVKDETHGAICVTPNFTMAENFSPLFCEYNNSGVMVPGDEKSQFVAVVGDPCRFKRYMLYPEDTSDDRHYLLLNGSVFAPHHDPPMLAPGVDYCMEIVPEMGLRTFVCFPEDRIITTADSRITIYACGLLISVPFLILTIVAYSITPKLKDVHGKALCHYCGCLTVAFTTLACTQLGSAHLSDQSCICIAFVIQFSFVACFFWLNVMCIETWALVQNYVDRERQTRMKPKKLFFFYSLWGWGPPAILILISMAMDLSPTIPTTYVKPNFEKESCWFKSDNEAMPYFYVPIGLLILTNVVLFILTFVKLTKYQKDLTMRRLARNEETDRLDQRFLRRLNRTAIVCVVLFFIMGLNWTMELISWWVGGDPLDWSAFDLVNALQGVLVFGLFVLRRPPRDFVWHRIQKLRGINLPEPEVGSMDLRLLSAINGDTLPRQTIIP